MARGRLQVYTGDGKGKTTAAIGVIIRAAACGEAVAFIQFDKGPSGPGERYAERAILRNLPTVEVHATGLDRIDARGVFRFGVLPEDQAEAARGLRITLEALGSRRYFLVVCDELITSVSLGLLPPEALDQVLSAHRDAPETELILTGRGATPALIARADLVTEMHCVKHYMDQGQIARKGIDF